MNGGQHRVRSWPRSISGNARCLLLLATLAALTFSTARPVSPTNANLHAAVETQPVPHAEDAADDPAIWLDPTDPGRSVIIGTDKQGGLAVYDLAGNQLAYYADSTPNNVDLRDNFPLGGERVALVVTSDTTADSLRVYRLDPVTRELSDVAARTLETGIGVAGLCLYHSPISGEYYAFVSDSSGTVQQWELRDNGAGRVESRKVRTISVGSTTEGCVADDRDANVFIAEEDVGIWRYGAEPDAGEERVSIDDVGPHLSADVEGLAIYNGGDRYLIASSQGSDDFAVYSLSGEFLGRFAIDDRDIDGVSHTDGIDVTNADLGGAFASGLFVAQDDHNGDENQNFKLVPWASVAQSFTPSLAVDTGEDGNAPVAAASPISTPSAAGTTTYFVDSRAGDDGNTGASASAPWQTLERVDALPLQPGDRILFRRGSAWTGTLYLHASGTSDKPILIGSYGSGDLPIFSGGCLDVTGSHIVVQEVRTSECSFAGVALAGSNNRVERCEVTTSVAGIYVRAGAIGNQVFNNQIVDNNRMSVLDQASENDSGAFGVLINGDETEVAFNTISGSDAFSYDYERDGAAIEIFGGQRNTVHHNVAIDNDAFVELGDPRAADNTLAYNLVMSSLPTSSGVVTRGDEDSRGPIRRTRLDNNTILLSGSESQGFVCHGGCSPEILVMRNNIVESHGKVGYADGPFDEDYNLFFGGHLQFTPGAHSIVADPNLIAGDFTPAPGSVAIDSGVSLGYRHDLAGSPVPADGNGDGEAIPDLGAYEYLLTMPSGAGSGGVGRVQGHGGMDRRPEGLDSLQVIVPVLKGGGGVTSGRIPRHCHERQEWSASRALPGPRAAVEVHRSRRAISKRSLFRPVRVPEYVKGRGGSGFFQRALHLGRSTRKVARLRTRPVLRARRCSSRPPCLPCHACQQAIGRGLCQAIDLRQDLGGDPRLPGLFSKHGGPIPLPTVTVPRQQTHGKVPPDRRDQAGKIGHDTRRAARASAHDIMQQAGNRVGRVDFRTKLGRDTLDEGIDGPPKMHIHGSGMMRFQPDERRERVEVVILLTMLSVEHPRYVIDPRKNAQIRPGTFQVRRSRQQVAQVSVHGWPHQLDVVITGHKIDGIAGPEPASKCGENLWMPDGDPVELGYRWLHVPPRRRIRHARQHHSWEVENVAEKQETVAPAGGRRPLPHRVQPARESGILDKWFHGIAEARNGIAAGGKVKIAHDGNRHLLTRRHAASTSGHCSRPNDFRIQDLYWVLTELSMGVGPNG